MVKMLHTALRVKVIARMKMCWRENSSSKMRVRTKVKVSGSETERKRMKTRASGRVSGTHQTEGRRKGVWLRYRDGVIISCECPAGNPVEGSAMALMH